MQNGINIRQSANIDRNANNSSTNGNATMQKNTNSQQFSNVQFNQNMIGASKARTGVPASSGYEMDNTGAGIGEETMRLR